MQAELHPRLQETALVHRLRMLVDLRQKGVQWLVELLAASRLLGEVHIIAILFLTIIVLYCEGALMGVHQELCGCGPQLGVAFAVHNLDRFKFT